jgi:diguanylate cyclase (GGDEF)-like protein
VLWLKLSMTFPDGGENRPYVLGTVVGNFRDIRIYRPRADGDYSEYVTGYDYPAAQREIPASGYSFHIDPGPGVQTVYLRTVGGINTLRLPWTLTEGGLFERDLALHSTINLLSVGALLAIFAFTAGIGITLGNRNYLFYSLFVAAGTISLFNQEGGAFIALWPDHPGFNYYATDIFNIAVSATRLLTIFSFLNIRRNTPRIYAAGKVWLWVLALLFVVACSTGLRPISELAGGVVWLITVFAGLAVSAYAVKKAIPLAKPLFLVLLIPVLGSLAQGAGSVGWLGSGVVEWQLAQIFFVVHALLFSMCIALQMKHEVDRRIIAQHDALTGLPSMLLARDRFAASAAHARRQGCKLAILFIDLDRFKPVNDTFGHEIGDRLLVEVAKRISACLRDVDTAARIGGDEFLIIQTGVGSDEAASRVAARILVALGEPFTLGGQEIRIGASIGIARYPDHGQDLDTVLKVADTAMYKVKNGGRNGFQLER